MLHMFKQAWAQILLAIAVGMLFLLYKDEWPASGLIHHIGTACIVAAIVTAFWHLREVSEVINKYVQAILLDYSYLSKLNLASLVELRTKAAAAILEKAADNPKYQRAELEAWIDRLLYRRLLPGEEPSSGFYRQDYEDKVVIEYLSLQQALKSEGLLDEKIPVTEEELTVMRIITTREYTVISPKVSDKQPVYPITYGSEGCGLPRFPADKLRKASVGNSQQNAIPLALKTRSGTSGQILWEAVPRTFKFENGQCKIWMRTVEYKSRARESFVLNTMALLTRNLRVTIQQVTGPAQVFVGQMLATPTDDIKPPEASVRVAALRYDGWLFEDHGYHFYWFDASEQDIPSKLAQKMRSHPVIHPFDRLLLKCCIRDCRKSVSARPLLRF